MEEVYISNGVEQFFLPALPAWVNFSQESSCYREQSIRYLNYEKLKKSYNLNYIKMLHLQHMFNRKLFAYRTSTGQDRLSLKDESFIFNNVYQQVVGNSFDFVVPNYKKVSIIWVDHFLKNPKKLKRILNRKDVGQGYPVIFSSCLTSYELEKLTQELGLDDLGVKFVSAEMESVFNFETLKQSQFTIELEKLFEGKELMFFGIEKPRTLSSNINFVKIK